MATITDRQIEIIEASGRILSSSGVKGFTIKNLAKEMKFSESAIYRHFESKEKIIIAMLEYLAINMDDRYSHATLSGQVPEEKLNALFINQFEFFSSNPHFVVAAFLDGLLEESDQINQAIMRIMDVKKKHLLPIVIEGQNKGVFINSVSSENIVHILMGAFRLHMFKWRVSDFAFDLVTSGRGIIRSLLILITK